VRIEIEDSYPTPRTAARLIPERKENLLSIHGVNKNEDFLDDFISVVL